jgi:hypothetical protein
MKRTLVGALVAAGLVVGLTGPAAAGEITGKGKATPILNYTASSICSFSGLNDGDGFDGRVQNWGAIPREDRAFLRSIGVSPGTECRGNVEHSD